MGTPENNKTLGDIQDGDRNGSEPAAKPLSIEKLLEIYRRLLLKDHPAKEEPGSQDSFDYHDIQS